MFCMLRLFFHFYRSYLFYSFRRVDVFSLREKASFLRKEFETPEDRITLSMIVVAFVCNIYSTEKSHDRMCVSSCLFSNEGL